MNRFCNRATSLALAILFALSSLGVTFSMVGSLPAAAAPEDSPAATQQTPDESTAAANQEDAAAQPQPSSEQAAESSRSPEESSSAPKESEPEPEPSSSSRTAKRFKNAQDAEEPTRDSAAESTLESAGDLEAVQNPSETGDTSNVISDVEVIDMIAKFIDDREDQNLLKEPMISANPSTFSLSITISFTDIGAQYYNQLLGKSLKALTFTNHHFIDFQDFSMVDIHREKEKTIIAIETGLVTYQNRGNHCPFSLEFEGLTIDATAILATADISDSQNYYFQGPRFRNQNGELVSKVTRGRYQSFTFTIKDEGITSEELELLRETVSISINSDFIRETNPKITNIRPLYETGVIYQVECVNPYYVGNTNMMLLEINYGDPYSIRTFYESIPGCELYNDDDEDDDDDDDDSSSSRSQIAPPTPNIIVSEYTYGGGTVTAASQFDLKIRFTNTSSRLAIDNIVMKVGVPEAFTLTSSSNTFYIKKMNKDSSVERTIGLSVKPNAEPISHPIKLSFSFEAIIQRERKQFTSEEEISIPVSQLDRFSVNPIEVPSELYVGEDTGIEVTFVNKGKTPVYNVTAEIAGNIAKPGQLQFIGDVENGKEESADFVINPLEDGELTGEVIISYEDSNMNVMVLRSPFSTTAIGIPMPPSDIPADTMLPEDFPPEELPWYQKIYNRLPPWGWAVIGVVGVLLFAYLAKLARTRHERKLLEGDDEDF